MQVPQIQFAQMPVFTPRSEMEGFSNALLQAGQMMVQRRAAAEQMARQQAQQNLENQMNQRRLDIAESAAEGEAKERSLRIGQMEKTSAMDEQRKAVIQGLAPQLKQIADPADRLLMIHSALSAQGLATPEDAKEVETAVASLRSEAITQQTARAPRLEGGFIIDPMTGQMKEAPLTVIQKAQLGQIQSATANSNAQAALAKIKSQMELSGGGDSLKLLQEGLDKNVAMIDQQYRDVENKKLSFTDRIQKVDVAIAKLQQPDANPNDILTQMPEIARLIDGGTDKTKIIAELRNVKTGLDTTRKQLDQSAMILNTQRNALNNARNRAYKLGLSLDIPGYTTQPGPMGPPMPTPEEDKTSGDAEAKKKIGEKQQREYDNAMSAIKNAASKAEPAPMDIPTDATMGPDYSSPMFPYGAPPELLTNMGLLKSALTPNPNASIMDLGMLLQEAGRRIRGG